MYVGRLSTHVRDDDGLGVAGDGSFGARHRHGSVQRAVDEDGRGTELHERRNGREEPVVRADDLIARHYPGAIVDGMKGRCP